MNAALLNLIGNLLLTTAASIGPQAPAPADAVFARSDSATEASASAATQRRQARAARISLADPYYSFSRAKRAHKD